MKKHLNNNGAFDPVFIGALAIVLIVGGFLFWKISQNQETVIVESPISKSEQNTQDDGENTELSEFVSEEYGFKFSYPSEWGNVTIAESLLKSKSGKAYDLSFDKYPKIISGFITRDWVIDESEVLTPSGFTVYGDCAVGPDFNNVLSLVNEETVCLIVAGSPKGLGGNEDPYAQLILNKKFSDESPYAGIEFISAPVGGIDDTSDESLSGAFPEDYTNKYIKIAKSLEEL